MKPRAALPVDLVAADRAHARERLADALLHRLAFAFFSVLAYAVLFAPLARAHGHSFSSDRHEPDSEDERGEQTVQALYGSRGYSLGLVVGRDRIIEAGYSGLNVELGDEDDEAHATGEGERWTHDVFLRTKLFSGNSFYTYWGAAYGESGPDGASFREPDRSDAWVLLGLGNQWCWRHATIGVDWAGLAVPVYTKVHKEAAEDDDRRVTVAARGLENVRVDWLKVYVGVAI